MLRLTDENVAAIKETLLKRLPGCYLSKEDVQELKEKTGLNHATILKFADHFRYNHKVEDREAALRAETSFEKV
jgi:nicotinic acid phosphoribosyltransferase